MMKRRKKRVHTHHNKVPVQELAPLLPAPHVHVVKVKHVGQEDVHLESVLGLKDVAEAFLPHLHGSNTHTQKAQIQKQAKHHTEAGFSCFKLETNENEQARGRGMTRARTRTERSAPR